MPLFHVILFSLAPSFFLAAFSLLLLLTYLFVVAFFSLSFWVWQSTVLFSDRSLVRPCNISHYCYLQQHITLNKAQIWENICIWYDLHFVNVLRLWNCHCVAVGWDCSIMEWPEIIIIKKKKVEDVGVDQISGEISVHLVISRTSGMWLLNRYSGLHQSEALVCWVRSYPRDNRVMLLAWHLEYPC